MSEDPTANPHGAQPSGPDGTSAPNPPAQGPVQPATPDPDIPSGFGDSAGSGSPPEPGTSPGYSAPPGYGTTPGYGAPPGYNTPPGYAPPPAYGAPPGYGPPPAYGAPPGYGPPPGYDTPAGYQGAWTGAIPPGYYAGPADPLVSQDFNGWWRRSFALLKTAWRPMVLIQLLSAVPVTAAIIIAGLTLDDRTFGYDTTTGTEPPNLAEIFGPLLALVPVVLVTLLLALVVPMATTHLLVQTATGRRASIGTALWAALRRAPSLLGWNLLTIPLLLVAVALCIVPIFYVAAVIAVLPVIVLLERGNGIGRAFRLFHADIGASLGRLATMAGVGLMIAVIASIFSSIIEGGTATVDPHPTLVVIAAVVSGAISAAGTIVVAPMYLTTYADMRARHEPFSTAYLMQA